MGQKQGISDRLDNQERGDDQKDVCEHQQRIGFFSFSDVEEFFQDGFHGWWVICLICNIDIKADI